MQTELESLLLSMKREIFRIGSPNGADVFQEVCLACVARKDANWAAPSSRWLILRIATNKTIDLGRREKFRRATTLDAIEEPPARGIGYFDEVVSDLAFRDSALVRGRFEHGKTFEELSAEFRCPAATLRTRWRRVRLRLKSEIS